MSHECMIMGCSGSQTNARWCHTPLFLPLLGTGSGSSGEAQCQYEWEHPEIPSGDSPGKRGYHSAAASPDGSKVYIFGGMAGRASINTLAGKVGGRGRGQVGART